MVDQRKVALKQKSDGIIGRTNPTIKVKWAVLGDLALILFTKMTYCLVKFDYSSRRNQHSLSKYLLDHNRYMIHPSNLSRYYAFF